MSNLTIFYLNFFVAKRIKEGVEKKVVAMIKKI
jgi:hypothetical protein